MPSGKMYIVHIDEEKGTKFLIELAQGAAMEVEYEHGDPPLFEAVSSYLPPTVAHVSLTGIMLGGKLWKEGDGFVSTEQTAIEESRPILDS